MFLLMPQTNVIIETRPVLLLLFACI